MDDQNLPETSVEPMPARAPLPELSDLGIEKPRISKQRKIAMVIVIVIATLGLFSLRKGVEGEKESIAQAKAAVVSEINSAMGSNYGGESHNVQQLALVGKVGSAIAMKSDVSKLGLKPSFHLVNEANSINVYGLPGGNIYVTTALLNRMQTEGQLAAALSHAVAHAMDNDALTRAQVNHPLPIWQHTLEQEKAADVLTIKLMSQAGYDPEAMNGMLSVLAKAYHDGADVQFFTTHPNAADRMQAISAAITTLYPQGIPAVLSK